MELLIVHHDADMGEQLVQMVKDYTSHQCEFVGSNAAAFDWGQRHARCALLLTQVEAQGIDGLALGGTLSETFPGLQTLFFPPYPASQEKLVIPDTKVFAEPIQGDALLEAIGRAETAPVDAPDLFHFADILQMCCLSRRTGAIQMVSGKRSGIVFLRGGTIIHAETAGALGKDALFEVGTWEYVEFAYDRAIQPPAETITIPWDELLSDAVERQKLHKLIQQRD